jgi:hypothetical protein
MCLHVTIYANLMDLEFQDFWYGTSLATSSPLQTLNPVRIAKGLFGIIEHICIKVKNSQIILAYSSVFLIIYIIFYNFL